MKINIIGLLLIVFFVFSGYLIVKSNNYNLKETDDGVSFAKDYSKWIWDTGKKTAKVVGAVVKEVSNEEWLPKNDTNTSNNSDEKDSKDLKVKLIYD